MKSRGITMSIVKNIIWIGLLVTFSGFTPLAHAEEKKPEQTTAQYLEEMQTRLDHAARRANKPTSEGSSVVGLRGAAQESASKQLYWKGRQGTEVVTPDEVKLFRSAIEQARVGKTAEATTSLKSFQEKYPKSALLPDVNETLAKLQIQP